jgi:hypothetical protein
VPLSWSQKYSLSSTAVTLKTVASDEGETEESIFLFGGQIKKYFSQCQLLQPIASA